MTKKALSLLWRSPRSAGQIEGRRVDFLELFYDLIYVVIVAELAHLLAEHVNLEAYLEFIFLFILIWWLWVNAALYHNLHGYDDLRTRIFAFMQMGILVVMTVFLHNAMEETSYGFALSYVAFLILLTFLWWRTGVHDPAHRPQTIPYITTYPIAIVLFIISIFVPIPYRFFIWIIAFLEMMIIPLIFSAVGQRGEYMLNIDVASPSLRERFKLFTIIVFGETIVGVVAGLSRYHHLDLTIGLTGTLGLILAFCLWWIYFDASADHPVKNKASWLYLWILIHLPIWLGITAIGPTVLNIISLEDLIIPTEILWLLVGSIALALFSIGVFVYSLDVDVRYKNSYRKGSFLLFGLSAFTLIFLILESLLTSIILLLGLFIILLIPLLYTLYIRVKIPEESQVS
jgi:low temperature requirement protein LtrA